MVVSKQFDYSKTSKNALLYRRTSQFIENLGITIQSGVSSSINGFDETRKWESLPIKSWLLDQRLTAEILSRRA